MPAPTVAFGLYDAIYLYLGQLGFAESKLCEHLDIKSKQEGVLYGRVPLSLYEHAFLAAQDLTGDDCIGLHMGQTALPSTYGVFYFLSIAGENLHQIMAAVGRYFPLMYDFITLAMTTHDTHLRIEFQYAQKRRPHRHVIEHLFSNWFTTANLLGFDEKKVPRALSLQQPQSCNDEVLRHVFNATPVLFEQASDEFVLKIDPLLIQIQQRDQRMFDTSEKQANDLMLRLRAHDRIAQQISAHVMAMLADGLPTLEQVALKMNCSARTLQRRLSERNLHYQMLLDHVRQDVAIRLLTTTELPITQIATHIGFTDDSTFHRAFKRWTGEQPGSYRS